MALRWVMRIGVTRRTLRHFICFSMIVLFATSILLPLISGQGLQPLSIEVYDSDTSEALQTDIVFEGKLYDITIGNEDGFVVNVTMTLLGHTYNMTNEMPFITITAPSMSDHESFIINASKEGYPPVERTLTVMKGALSIHTDRITVEEKKEFQVTIKDQDSHPVEDAVVYIDPNGTHISTDAQGFAYLTAPEVDQNKNITIITMKDGYIDSSTSILVQLPSGSVPTIGNSLLVQIAPILFATVAVIFAILYVRWRKKTQKDLPPSRIDPVKPKEDLLENTTDLRKKSWEKEPASYHVKERRPTSISSSDSRVEEIRIPLQEKRKETTILPKETPSEPTVSRHKNEEDEWFKGQEYMRYKLDEMTGNIDQKNEGKWFEGERDIQSKVDEALKKQSKKKKVDQHDMK